MALLQELGTAVRRRRQEIGLSQGELARIAELSRATVTSLENGTLKNLSSTRIEKLANALGFAVGLLASPGTGSAGTIEAAARVASVPYRKAMPPAALREALLEGIVPPGFIPQLRTLLQEAPVATLAAIADELQHDDGAPVKETWARMRALAAVLKCDRPIWARGSS
jgi:transcriptional regulator with XRE-family HTH domain